MGRESVRRSPLEGGPAPVGVTPPNGPDADGEWTPCPTKRLPHHRDWWWAGKSIYSHVYPMQPPIEKRRSRKAITYTAATNETDGQPPSLLTIRTPRCRLLFTTTDGPVFQPELAVTAGSRPIRRSFATVAPIGSHHLRPICGGVVTIETRLISGTMGSSTLSRLTPIVHSVEPIDHSHQCPLSTPLFTRNPNRIRRHSRDTTTPTPPGNSARPSSSLCVRLPVTNPRPCVHSGGSSIRTPWTVTFAPRTRGVTWRSSSTITA